MMTDRVCGKDVDRRGAEREGLVVERHGTTYAFCSKACKERFEAEPGRYVGMGAVGGTAPDGQTAERYAG